MPGLPAGWGAPSAGLTLKRMHVPTSCWHSAFRSALLTFPAGKHDDQVDALGLLGQLLDQMVPGQKPRVPVKPKPDSGYRPVSLGQRPLDWIVF